MIKTNAQRGLTILIMLLLVLPVVQWAQDAEDMPVTVRLTNNSGQSVKVHVTSFDMSEAMHQLEPGQDMELEVPFGKVLRLEYPSKPYKTTLSPLGSLNETNRTITVRADGEHLFIQEQFSGQRSKGTGELRNKWGTVSDPEIHRANNPSQPPEAERKDNTAEIPPDAIMPKRKEDPDKPAPKDLLKKKDEKKDDPITTTKTKKK